MNEYTPDNVGEYTVQERRDKHMMVCVHGPVLEHIGAESGDVVEFVETDTGVVMQVKE